MSNPFKTAEFRKLFKIWNNILEETGHNEIEDFSMPDPALKEYESRRWVGSHHRSDPLSNEQIQQYYEMASALLHTFSFKSRLHRNIWMLHCRGVSPRKMASMIGRKGLSKSTIYSIIWSIEQASGLKRG